MVLKNDEEQDLVRQQKINILSLKRIRILNENEQEVLISDLWKDSQVVIVFVRHFGCIACRAHVDKIWNLWVNMKKIKTRIVFIGNGNACMIKAFKQDMNLHKAEIYTDPSLKAFDACGMNRSILNLVNIKTLSALRELKRQGYTQGDYEDNSGSHTQMGGVIAIKHPGLVTYHFTSKYLGDFDEPEKWGIE